MFGNATANAEDVAKQEGAEALDVHRRSMSSVVSVLTELDKAIKELNTSKTMAGRMNKDLPSRAQTLREIGELETEAEAARTAVTALEGAVAVTFQEDQKKTALSKIMEEVENNMTAVVEDAAAIVAGNVFAIGAAIEKAGELGAAADKARGLWDVAERELAGQLNKAREAVAVVTTTITAVKNAAESFGKSSDLRARAVSKELSVVKNILEPSLERLVCMQNVSQDAREAARVASAKYGELAEKAGKWQQAAEDRRQRVEEGARGLHE